MRFIHSADWQLGARFPRFGVHAATLRAARLRALQTALNQAKELQVDAFLIAGDLFEDNQVDLDLVAQTAEILREATFPIFILPGNHDPYTGPDSVWERPPFQNLPSHIHIFRHPQAIPIADAYILGAPLTQKVSRKDPTQVLDRLAATIPSNALRIGMCHGSPLLPGRTEESDFPIPLNAATRAGLDYLALGHWHRFQSWDGNRMVMCGTPEPEDFQTEGKGAVLLVEITTRGVPPQIQPIPVATLQWTELELPIQGFLNRPDSLQVWLQTHLPPPHRSVVRIRLTGPITPAQLRDFQNQLRQACAAWPICEIVDQTVPTWTSDELEHLKEQHPILAQVLSDLNQLQQASISEHPLPVDPTIRKLLQELPLQHPEEEKSLLRAAQDLLVQILREHRVPL